MHSRLLTAVVLTSLALVPLGAIGDLCRSEPPCADGAIVAEHAMHCDPAPAVIQVSCCVEGSELATVLAPSEPMPQAKPDQAVTLFSLGDADCPFESSPAGSTNGRGQHRSPDLYTVHSALLI